MDLFDTIQYFIFIKTTTEFLLSILGNIIGVIFSILGSIFLYCLKKHKEKKEKEKIFVRILKEDINYIEERLRNSDGIPYNGYNFVCTNIDTFFLKEVVKSGLFEKFYFEEGLIVLITKINLYNELREKITNKLIDNKENINLKNLFDDWKKNIEGIINNVQHLRIKITDGYKIK